MVEIAKAFRAELSVLILDEPTASLTERETRAAVRPDPAGQAPGGRHHLHHAPHERDQAHRRSHHRAARRPARRDAAGGGGVGDPARRADDRSRDRADFPEGRTIVRARCCWMSRNLTTATGTVSDVSIQVRAGEIVGLAGLVGSGKSEVARACFGVEPARRRQGHLRRRATSPARTPRAMLDRGFFYLPPDRRGEGLVMVRGARENISLAVARPGALFERPVARSRRGAGARRSSSPSDCNLQPLNLERAARAFLRRQSAEGAAGEGVVAARCGCSCSTSRPSASMSAPASPSTVHPRSLRGRRGDPADLVRPAGDPASDQPRLCDVSRQAAGRATGQRDHRGQGAALTSSSGRRRE